MDSKTLAIELARALDAKKALNIRILKVEDLTTVTDYFVIATGTSTTHVGALADEADFILSQQGVNPCVPKATTASAGCCWITAALSYTSSPRKPMITMIWNIFGPTLPSLAPTNG